MNLLFVHDHKFRTKNGKYYSTGALDHMALKRYVDVFDKVTILARVIEEDKCDKYSQIKHKNVEIVNIKNLSVNQVKTKIEKSDRLIVRLPSFYGMFALFLNLIVKKPYLIEMVGCPWDEFWNYSWKTKFIAPFVTIIDKLFVKNAPYVIYVTNKFLQGRYPTNGKQLACSNVTLTQTDETVLRKRLDKIKNEHRPLIIGTTAALNVRYKGQQHVIRALKYLHDQGINRYIYQMVGNGDAEYLNKVIARNEVNDKVEILGGIPHEKVFDWLDTIDIYIQPSKQEGLPRALIEAMSRGLPAIGSNTAGIPELLDDEYIYIHNQYEYKDIANLLLKITENMEEQSKINFAESKKYDNELLEKRRNEFLVRFKSQV